MSDKKIRSFNWQSDHRGQSSQQCSYPRQSPPQSPSNVPAASPPGPVRADRPPRARVPQVKRPGDRSVRCTILLLLDNQPPQFKLDPRLARLLGVHTQSRPVITQALWQYVKHNNLQVRTAPAALLSRPARMF